MDERLPVSILLLTRNEERRLPDYLAAVRWAAEVVVVDSDSTDRTLEIARAAGARAFAHPLEGFGPQRQFALERCTQPWVLWLDADERLDERALAALRAAVAAGGADAYRIRRVGYFLGRRVRFSGWQNDRVLRLFRREAARFNDKPIHESAVVQGVERRLEGAIHHHTYENWQECVGKLASYAEAGAQRARAQGRRATPLDLVWRPPARFVRQYLLQLGFLDGAHGLVLCALSAAQVLLKYARLWELSRERA
jgi:glycosyltransferase involved in cell wall biosynthesis